MTVPEVRCSTCGRAVPAFYSHCLGCGAAVDGPVPPITPFQGRPGAGRVARPLGAVLLFALLAAGIAFGLFRVAVDRASVPIPTVTATPASTAPLVLESGDYLAWYPQRTGVPILTRLDADAVEDVVGLRWDASRPEAALWVVATSGATLTTLWKAGPFKSQWQGQRTHFERSGDWLYLTDSTNTLHILDLRTGFEKHGVQLPCDAYDLCAAREGASRVWVGGSTGRAVTVDSEGTITDSATQPKWCVPYWQRLGGNCQPDEGCAKTVDPIPVKVTGFSPDYALRADDGTRVDVGHVRAKDGKPPGTPYAVGFQKTSAVAWDGPMIDVAEGLHLDPSPITRLAHGRLYASYQTSAGTWRLFARDASSGAILFSVVVPHAEEGAYRDSLTTSDTRLYLVIDNRLEVFDAATGSRLGSVPAS